MSWRGEAGGIEAARQHHNVIMTPNTYLYFDYYQTKHTEDEPIAIGGFLPVDIVYSYEPMPEELTAEEQKYISGVQANLWTEYIPTFSQAQYMVLPRMAALSEIQWCSAANKNYDRFLASISRLIDIYQLKGWNYATHLFDVNVKMEPDTEKGKMQVTLTTIDNCPVYYTLDGTEPKADSPKYAEPLQITESCKLKAVAVRSHGNSRIFEDSIVFNKATMKPITMLQPINKQYEFNGAVTLVDGLAGNNNYKTGRWIAFYKNKMEAVIDLKESQEITSAGVRTCVQKGDWVFDITSLCVMVSEDNKEFKLVAAENYPPMKQNDPDGVHVHKLTFDPVKARYVKVIATPESKLPAWHGGSGNEAFFFVDEIIIE